MCEVANEGCGAVGAEDDGARVMADALDAWYTGRAATAIVLAVSGFGDAVGVFLPMGFYRLF